MTRLATIRRRAVSISGVAAVAVALTALLVPVLVGTALVDLVRLRPRLPTARLALFGVCWAWLELAGIAASAGLWALGRAGDQEANGRLQRWWADRLIRALTATLGARVDVEGAEALAGAPAVALVRHVSLADSLVTAWTLTNVAHRQLRIVLKHELLADPCLDIVGNRLPNCFLDRGAEDAAPGLAAIAELGTDLGERDVAVIFPEGTRANDAKRRRALERIAERDAERAERLSVLQHVLPPRPAGTRSLLGAAQPTDVVLGWHVGLEGFDTLQRRTRPDGSQGAAHHDPIRTRPRLRGSRREHPGLRSVVGRSLDRARPSGRRPPRRASRLTHPRNRSPGAAVAPRLSW